MAEEVGNLKVKLTLDNAQFERSVASMNKTLQAIGQEIRGLQNKGKDWGSSLDGLKEKQDAYSRLLEGQQTKVKKLAEEYEKAKEEQGEYSNKAQNLATALNKASAEMDRTERELSEITAELKKQEEQLRISQSSWGKLSESLTEVGNKLKDVGEKMTDIGKSLSMKVTAPITALGVGAAKAAIDFESAFAGVRKTVNTTEEGFEKLERGILDMARTLPASATDIAAVAESAGQLGIAEENILSFTKTIVDLGEATNLTAEQGASEFARFANIVGMNQDNFDRLGSSIVALGNNFATTESEIMSLAMRLAGAGSQIGLSESDILGLSTALSSVGIQAEMGGSAFSKIMVNMKVATTSIDRFNKLSQDTGMSLADLRDTADRGGSAFSKLADTVGMTKGEMKKLIESRVELERFAAIAGMTGEQFKQSFEVDAIGAIGAFVEGLGNAEAQGTSAIEMIQELGINEVQLRDALLRAGGASEMFADAIKVSSDAWEENTALTNEAEQRYATTASQLAMLKNMIVEVGISFGQVMLPFLIRIVEMITPVVTKFAEMDSTLQTIILVIGGLVAAVGPLLVIIGMLISSVGTIAGAFGAVSTAIATAGGVTAALSGALAPLGTAFAALTGPIGLTVAAIGGVIAILVVAYNKVDWFREMVQATFEKIKDFTMTIFNGIKDTITSLISSTVEFSKGLLDRFKEFWDENGQFISQIVQKYFGYIKGNIEMVMGIIKGIFEVVWPIIHGIVKYVWEAIQLTIGNAIEIILGTIQFILKILQGDWKGAWETIKQTAENIMNNIVKFFKDIDLVQVGKDIIQGLINGIASMAKAVWDNIKNIAKGIKDTFTNLLGINSPSKVFDEYGNWIGKGLVIGIDDSLDMVKKAADGLAEMTSASFETQLTLDSKNQQSMMNGLAQTIAATNQPLDLSGLTSLVGQIVNRPVELLVNLDGQTIARTVSTNQYNVANMGASMKGVSFG